MKSNLGYNMKADRRRADRGGVRGTEVTVLGRVRRTRSSVHQFTLVIVPCMNYCRRSGVENGSFTR